MDVDAPSLRPGLAPQDILKGYTRRDSKAEEGAFRRSGGGRRERGQAPRRLGASPLSLGRTFSYTLSDRGTSLATARPALVQRTLDIPAGKLAAQIGTWPEPALLESGPGF